MKKKIITLLILLILLLFLYFIFIRKTKVVFNSNMLAEINSNKYILDYIKEIENGKLITKNKKIDTSSLGKKIIKIKVKDLWKIKEYKFTVNVKDTQKPIIESNTEFKTFTGKEIDLLNGVKVTDNSKENLTVIIIGEYDFYKAGTYNLKYYTKDSSNNETYKDFILKVEDDPNNKVYKTSKGYNLYIKDGVASINGIVLANKSYSLPSNYGSKLTDETMLNFNKMKDDALKEGINLNIISGFRSYNDQNIIYNNYVKKDGKKLADTYSARPGHSEHQTGFAMDINSLKTDFQYTKEGIWLNNNAYKYGFILRYPKGKENITGYMFEPWHYRYVGELSKTLYNNGSWITLEEYFGIDSYYR